MASPEEIVAGKRTARAQLIPQAWKVPQAVIDQHALRPIRVFQEPVHPAISPGILSSHELALTDPQYDVVNLLGMLHAGKVSSEELVTAFCKRAAIAHQLTNCLSEILFESAIAAAQQRDDEFKTKPKTSLGSLHGLPLTFKDSFHIKGVDSSIGIVALCNQPATKNSQCVDIARNNGGVIIAKTCVPTTMLCADTDSVVFGRTCNAHRGDFGAAGSTGGEGALIAMGGSPLGVGTDGAGSVRMPAFVNGIVGYKPSGYRYPLDGVPILGKGFMGSTCIGPVSVAGPLTRSVRDAQLFTKLVAEARPWDRDPFVLPNPWLDIQGQLPSHSLRIGVWQNHDHLHLMPPVARGLQLAQQRLHCAGHVLVPFDGPSLSEVWDLQKQWVEVQGLAYLRQLLSSEPTVGIVERTKIITPDHPAPDLTLGRLHYLNERIAQLVVAMAAAWNAHGEPLDTVLFVPAPHPAMPFDEYLNLSFTGLMNLCDLPAIVLPLGENVSAHDLTGQYIEGGEYFCEDDRRIEKIWLERQRDFLDLPLSIQLIGRRGEDERLLAFAEVVHRGIANSKDRMPNSRP